jgi:hypothetical protein
MKHGRNGTSSRSSCTPRFEEDLGQVDIVSDLFVDENHLLVIVGERDLDIDD